jgi:hypothetical protein
VEVIGVTNRPVGSDRFAAALDGQLGDEHPAVGFSGVGEEAGEGGFGGAFVGDLRAGVGGEGLVVELDRFVSRLESAGGHQQADEAGASG